MKDEIYQISGSGPKGNILTLQSGTSVSNGEVICKKDDFTTYMYILNLVLFADYFSMVLEIQERFEGAEMVAAARA